MSRTVEVRFKRHTLLGNFRQGVEAEYLEPAAVRQDGVAPVHEMVQSAELLDYVMSRPHIEMIGIAENDLRPAVFQIFRRKRLDRRLRTNRHEHRRIDRAVRRGEYSQPGLRMTVLMRDLEFKGRTLRGIHN